MIGRIIKSFVANRTHKRRRAGGSFKLAVLLIYANGGYIGYNLELAT
jgi:hypothetical protein